MMRNAAISFARFAGWPWRIWVTGPWILLALLLVFPCGLRAEGPAATPDTGIPMVILNPGCQDWFNAMKAARRREENLTELLISAAQDGKRSDEERRCAVKALGIIGNERSFSFLLEHADMEFPLPTVFNFQDLMRQFPCQLALQEGGWQSLGHIFKRAHGQPFEPKQIGPLAHVIALTCGTKVAISLLEAQAEVKYIPYAANSDTFSNRWNLRVISDDRASRWVVDN